MFNSAEHELINAHKYEYIKNLGFFQAQIGLELFFSCSSMLKCQQIYIHKQGKIQAQLSCS